MEREDQLGLHVLIVCSQHGDWSATRCLNQTWLEDIKAVELDIDARYRALYFEWMTASLHTLSLHIILISSLDINLIRNSYSYIPIAMCSY